jgi:hypothetical protein
MGSCFEDPEQADAAKIADNMMITMAWRTRRRSSWPNGTAFMTLAAGLAWQGWPEEAESWIQRAERTVRPEAEPATTILVYSVRGSRAAPARRRQPGLRARLEPWPPRCLIEHRTSAK